MSCQITMVSAPFSMGAQGAKAVITLAITTSTTGAAFINS
jgi:hypothetical protein